MAKIFNVKALALLSILSCKLLAAALIFEPGEPFPDIAREDEIRFSKPITFVFHRGGGISIIGDSNSIGQLWEGYRKDSWLRTQYTRSNNLRIFGQKRPGSPLTPVITYINAAGKVTVDKEFFQNIINDKIETVHLYGANQSLGPRAPSVEVLEAPPTRGASAGDAEWEY